MQNSSETKLQCDPLNFKICETNIGQYCHIQLTHLTQKMYTYAVLAMFSLG